MCAVCEPWECPGSAALCVSPGSVPPLNVMFDGSKPLARSSVRTPRWVVGFGSCPAVMAALSEVWYSLVVLSYE